jgi:hypothetical protein
VRLVYQRFFHCSKRKATAEIKPVEVAPRREVVTAVPVAAPKVVTAEVVGDE